MRRQKNQRLMGITEELRWTAAKLMKVGKYAVDSAVNESLRGGMQVYTIVREKWQGEPTSKHSENNKKQNFVLVEEIQSKLEKMQEDMNKIKQQNNASTHRTKKHEHLKQFSDEPMKSSLLEVTDRKKTFIRSRL